jgi:citronellol/citronellal dehydrogenase
VNVRGTYLCCYHTLPHLIENGWGHVVTMSPPISADPSPGRVAYATTKMGMTRIALGVAAEHKKDNVASNALWPATLIESQATINWGMEDRSRWRSPEILSDATMEILKSKPKTLTAGSWWTRSSCASEAGPRRRSTPIGSAVPRPRSPSG